MGGEIQGNSEAENLREYMRRLTARPHNVGSRMTKTNATWIAAEVQESGSKRRLKILTCYTRRLKSG